MNTNDANDNNNQFFMENGSNFIPNMENCHYYPNDANASNIVGNATSHTNANNNNSMLMNLNGNDEATNNGSQSNRHVNVITAIGETENNRWNENMLSMQSQQLSNDNGATSMSGSATHVNGRIPTIHSSLATASVSPLQTQAIWNAFHNPRNPWHFNGIPNCYQRLYNANPMHMPSVNTTSTTNAQNHYPYYHHSSLHHLDHIDPRAMPVYAQNQQGLLFHYSKQKIVFSFY